MDYNEFKCKSDCISLETKELLAAFLANIGFESFYEENNEFKAYIQTTQYDADALCETMQSISNLCGQISYSINEIPSKNWNTAWESTFSSVEISDKIIVHTPDCVPQKNYEHEILIDPKMSFGSGTHETTSMILQMMLDNDFQDKTVADCGCGTGILGIFAEKLGASSVFAFDYDSCCVENTKTNCNLNNCQNLTVELGKLDLLNGKKFDIVIANINRNILIDNMQFISQSVKKQGIVILSGFYSEDVPIIEKSANKFGLELAQTNTKNNWTITKFILK